MQQLYNKTSPGQLLPEVVKAPDYLAPKLRDFYEIVRSYTRLYGFLRDSTGFYEILRVFTGFYGFLRDYTGFYEIFNFSRFIRNLYQNCLVMQMYTLQKYHQSWLHFPLFQQTWLQFSLFPTNMQFYCHYFWNLNTITIPTFSHKHGYT